MSAPKALKATSLRDSLGKTVRLLTKQGIDVQFRGHQPCVLSRGDKVVKLVLPELNDNAAPELIEALQGFLDHEVGHIFYTPFAKCERFGRKSPNKQALANILEDIRLEKLLPRDLPGTKENLERMYESVMDSFFGPAAMRAKDPLMSKSDKFSSVMVVALRALSGQKAFQKFMDDHALWPHFAPLMKRMPELSRRLRSLETFDDVMRLTDDIIEAIKAEVPPPPPPPPEDDKSQGDEEDDAKGSATDDEDDDTGQGESDDDDADDEEGGCGHGDGEGTDDEEGDEDNTGDCKGGPGDDEGDADGDESDEDGDDTGDKGGSDADGDGDEDGDDEDGDTPADSDLEGNPNKTSKGKDGRENRSLRDALALLEPTQRRAIFLYNKRHKTVEQIAEDLSITEDETVDLLATARKRLRELLNGG